MGGKMSRNKGAAGEREEWRPAVGYEGRYEVSNLGRVKSLPKYNRYHSIIMRQQISKIHGRVSVNLCKTAAEHYRVSVHRLVAQAFVLNPAGLPEINHIDENPLNNCAENLEWCDRKYNMNYGNTPLKFNEKNKKPVEAMGERGELIVFNSIYCARKLGFDSSGVIRAIRAKKKYKGYFWRYCNAA